MDWADLVDLEHELHGGYHCPYLGGWCYEEVSTEVCDSCEHYISFCEYYERKDLNEKKKEFTELAF